MYTLYGAVGGKEGRIHGSYGVMWRFPGAPRGRPGQRDALEGALWPTLAHLWHKFALRRAKLGHRQAKELPHQAAEVRQNEGKAYCSDVFPFARSGRKGVLYLRVYYFIHPEHLEVGNVPIAYLQHQYIDMLFVIGLYECCAFPIYPVHDPYKLAINRQYSGYQ